jgi:hypothetical protein
MLTGSRNLQFLVIVSCSGHPRTSFQICNTKGLILKHHHATTIRIVINKSKSRGLTIPTELVKKHAKEILPGNGKAITNFNILAKTSLGQRFPIPYLDTFSIVGSQIDGLKIVFGIFHNLQTVPGVPRYTICPLECPVTSPTIYRSFQYLAPSWLYFHDIVHLLCIESSLPFPCFILRHFFDCRFPDWRAHSSSSNDRQSFKFLYIIFL